MKILIISTLYAGGGAEFQSKFEHEYLYRNGYEVKYITFDPNYATSESIIPQHINLIGDYKNIDRQISNYFRNSRVERELRECLKEFNPDIIHLHQIGYAYVSICKVIKEYPAIQTIHDYGIICDKGTCIYQDNMPCSNNDVLNCLHKCYSHSFKAFVKYLYRIQVRRRQDRARRKCIDKLVSPSKCLTSYLLNNKYDVVCINNAIDVEEFSKYKKNLINNKKIVLCYGALRRSKGIWEIVNAFDKEEYTNIELHVIGGFDNGRIEDSYNEEELMALFFQKGVVYHGAMSHREVIDFLQKTFAVVVPSIWMENYPTTAIEGILGKCVVCGSDRGGVPELIENEYLKFDVLNEMDIKRCLMRINELSMNDYNKICEQQIRLFNTNNSPQVYFDNIMKLFSEVRGLYED